MDTVRVNIAYRPLRICWAIKAGDMAAFREAVRLNYALWGGRFNPIVIVDREDRARAIVEAFRADIVCQLGTSEEAKAFADSFPHLISPFFPNGIFVGKGKDVRAQVLDVQNAIASRLDAPEWNQIKKRGPRIYRWEDSDPLADAFLIHFGAYPANQNIDIDYESMFKTSLEAAEVAIEGGSSITSEMFDHPSIAYLSRLGLRQHYSVQSKWGWPGFYIGDASNLDDLVAFWNLRACDVSALFVDRNHIGRYAEIIPSWKKRISEQMSHRRFHENHEYAVWWRSDRTESSDQLHELHTLIGDEPCLMCAIDQHEWGGSALAAPLMHFGESSSLGVLSDNEQKPKLSFGLSDRPYATNLWFHSQLLVASVDFIGGLHGRDDYTLDPPYIPELNEFYARAMHVHYNLLRIESQRIGIVVDAHDADSFIYALPTAELFKRVFEYAGFDASPSSGGLIARQLIAQLGGLQGGRVFKIPGVRRLLKTHGPLASFSRNAALQLIGKRDPDNPNARFSDHKNLYIEPRERGENLTPTSVFSHLVRQGLFRIGVDLLCPSCQLRNWFPLDDLRQRVTCQMCGEPFVATSQLIEGEWAYRRSGLLGTERNAQGAVPVLLTLQQLDANLHSLSDNRAYSASLDLKPKNGQLGNPCEVDFAWIIPRGYPERTIVIVGECKDRGQAAVAGGDGGTINAIDIENLRTVADSFPKKRFEVFILLSKLCAFTPQEIELARSLNYEHLYRVIMLTDRELEPYHLYERTQKLFKMEQYATSVDDLARATVYAFLNPQPLDQLHTGIEGLGAA
ncbi:hypothetical protein [Cupriavidus metallidurans]|uniref:hypothetical protein n=1 Tax=Cupriavidus metallidurans TaxID=119219 RepID=UPI001BFBFE0C|nr:hypothetical protein [Cupriavidus metallidurans]QWC87785.1 hypothetical protein KB891_12110 [Cupriavidus metallidurans]